MSSHLLSEPSRHSALPRRHAANIATSSSSVSPTGRAASTSPNSRRKYSHITSRYKTATQDFVTNSNRMANSDGGGRTRTPNSRRQHNFDAYSPTLGTKTLVSSSYAGSPTNNAALSSTSNQLMLLSPSSSTATPSPSKKQQLLQQKQKEYSQHLIETLTTTSTCTSAPKAPPLVPFRSLDPNFSQNVFTKPKYFTPNGLKPSGCLGELSSDLSSATKHFDQKMKNLDSALVVEALEAPTQSIDELPDEVGTSFALSQATDFLTATTRNENENENNNNSPSKDKTSSSPRRQQKAAPLVLVAIDIGNGETGSVALREDSDCSLLTKEFVERHDLDEERVLGPLTKYLQTQLATAKQEALERLTQSAQQKKQNRKSDNTTMEQQQQGDDDRRENNINGEGGQKQLNARQLRIRERQRKLEEAGQTQRKASSSSTSNINKRRSSSAGTSAFKSKAREEIWKNEEGKNKKGDEKGGDGPVYASVDLAARKTSFSSSSSRPSSSAISGTTSRSSSSRFGLSKNNKNSPRKRKWKPPETEQSVAFKNFASAQHQQPSFELHEDKEQQLQQQLELQLKAQEQEKEKRRTFEKQMRSVPHTTLSARVAAIAQQEKNSARLYEQAKQQKQKLEKMRIDAAKKEEEKVASLPFKPTIHDVPAEMMQSPNNNNNNNNENYHHHHHPVKSTEEVQLEQNNFRPTLSSKSQKLATHRSDYNKDPVFQRMQHRQEETDARIDEKRKFLNSIDNKTGNVLFKPNLKKHQFSTF